MTTYHFSPMSPDCDQRMSPFCVMQGLPSGRMQREGATFGCDTQRNVSNDAFRAVMGILS